MSLRLMFGGFAVPMPNIETRLTTLEKTAQMNTISLDVIYDKYYALKDLVTILEEVVDKSTPPLKYK